MSTFKKVVSLMLCFAMLLSTVAIAGNIVAPKASAAEAPVSGIDSYADLADKYDNFVYLGLEFYEQTEGGEYTLTDYKVQAGQDLRMYFYIKTDMYLGGGNPYIIFDRNFFDVTNGATNLTYDETYDAAHADYPTENYPSLVEGTMNPAHSAVVDYGVTVTMTTKWARNVNGFTEKTQTNWHGIELAESDEWDFVFGSWMRDNNGLTSWEAKDDAYYYSWDIKVREFMPDGTTKLADGTTGFVKNDSRMFKRYDASSVTSKRVSYVAVDPSHINYASMKANNKCDFLTIDSFLLDDCNHTFTIDSTSVPGEYGPTTEVKKYNVTFTEADGTVVATGSYAEGTEIDVPAAAENELGWANTRTGVIDAAVVSGEKFTVGKANLTFQRVLTTDEFDIVLNLDGGTIDGETELTIKAGYGEEVDLNDYLPEKAGYTASWNPSTIKVENINGASAKVSWTANTYTATFYADEEGTTVSETVEIKYNTNLTSKVKPVKEGYEFAGWVDADGNLASLVAGGLGLGKYTKTENSSYYPSWTQLPCSITVMTKDFVTGEWSAVLVKYGKETDTLTASQLADIRNGLDIKEAYNWDGEVYYNPANASAKIGADEATATTIGRNETISFSGHQIIWIQADPIVTIEYNLPVFDEVTGEYTDEYETFTVKKNLAQGNTANVPVSAAAPVDGYVFKGWVTAEGETPAYSTTTSNYIFPISIETAKIVVYAKYELKSYDIKFFGIGNETNSNATIIIKGGFRIGDTIDLDAAEYVFDSPAALAGQTAAMPIIGKENSEQPIKFSGRDGYKFTGFYFYKDNEAAELDGITVTEEFIEQYAVAGSNGANDYIQIGATWEAQSYDAVFKYETAEGTQEIVVTVPVGSALATFDPSKDAEQMALITAGTPEGSVFIRWSYDQELTATGAMVAGGVTYTAVYNKVQLKVYVDYNNGSEPQSLSTVRYGDDTMAEGDETGEGRGIYYVVKTIQLDAYRPTETHESIGWTVYHVHDEADVNDPTKWHEGVNDDGTNEAKYTLIYKNEWKQHGEFFFTLYGTDGKIFCALGKNFKLYFWENRRSCDKDDANFLHNPELLVLFLKPEFVKDESGLCLKLTPFALNRSLFTFENIGALFEALGTLLGSLINGEL